MIPAAVVQASMAAFIHDGMDTLRTRPPLPTRSRITMGHLAVSDTLQPGCKRLGFYVVKPAVFHPNPRPRLPG